MKNNSKLKIEKADITGWKITTPDGNVYYIGEYSTHAGCYGNEGVTYKDRHAFETGEGVCYIPEYGFENKDQNNGDLFEFSDKSLAASELPNNPYISDGGYTRQALIDLCNGEADFAKDLFDHLDWMAPETLWEEYLDDEEFFKEVEKRERQKEMQNMREIETEAGSLYIEKIGEQEEDERIKIYDSMGRYLDYFSVESIQETAEVNEISFEEQYEEFIRIIAKSKTVEEILDQLGINYYILETDKAEFVKKLVDYNIDDDSDIDDNEYINIIGNTYILIAE